MDIEQALQIVKNVTAEFKGTLQDHNQIQTALSTIEQELTKKESKKNESVQKQETKNLPSHKQA